MSVEMWIGFAIGCLVGGVIMAVFMGSIAHQQFEKYQTEKAKVFALDQQLLDALEGNVERHWRMRSDGVDVIVERGRPDIRSKPVQGHPEGAVIDLTEFEKDDWDE